MGDNLKKYDNILKELQNHKKDLITIDTEYFNSSKKFEEGTVFKIEKHDWGEEILPSLAVYLCGDMIGTVAEDKYDTADICSKASEIEYVPGETFARYLGVYKNNNFRSFHIAQIIDNNEQKEINCEKGERGYWIGRFDLQAHDYVHLLNVISRCAENNQSAKDILKIVKEDKLYRLR